jgi:hypothetical protein
MHVLLVVAAEIRKARGTGINGAERTAVAPSAAARRCLKCRASLDLANKGAEEPKIFFEDTPTASWRPREEGALRRYYFKDGGELPCSIIPDTCNQ